jgi:hypothetical protein
MKSILLIILFPCLFFPTDNQTSWKAENDFIAADYLGNIFLVRGSVLEQYDTEGNKLNSYTNFHLGQITGADVSDPMRISLYFGNFNHVVFLNRQLSEISEPVNLDDLGFTQVPVACGAAKGGVWLYDSQNMQLVYINSGNEIVQKGTMLQSVAGTDVSPTKLLEEDDRLILFYPGVAVLLFDLYGNFLRKVPADGCSDITLAGEKLLLLNERSLVRYNIKTFDADTVSLETNITPVSIAYSPGYYVLSDKKSVFMLREIPGTIVPK